MYDIEDGMRGRDVVLVELDCWSARKILSAFLKASSKETLFCSNLRLSQEDVIGIGSSDTHDVRMIPANNKKSK